MQGNFMEYEFISPSNERPLPSVFPTLLFRGADQRLYLAKLRNMVERYAKSSEKWWRNMAVCQNQ